LQTLKKDPKKNKERRRPFRREGKKASNEGEKGKGGLRRDLTTREIPPGGKAQGKEADRDCR